MDKKTAAIQELSAKASEASTRSVLVGLDGFVDTIINPVDRRFGPGDNYEPIREMAAFGNRIVAAAGKSTNIEMGKITEKLGGNGPILANAVLAAGFPTRYVGALGIPEIHPVFKDMAAKTDAVSLAEPGVTYALEFKDGKVMLGLMDSLEEVTYSKVLEKMGEGAFFDLLSRTDLFAVVNWTMLPFLTGFLQSLIDQVYPNLGPRDHRSFFFDLADPAKRSDGDLVGVLRLLGRFCAFGSTTLGLNLSEAQHVSRVLGLPSGHGNEEDIRGMARSIRSEIGVDCVVVHPLDCAACATKEDTFYTDGFFTADPTITTGGGDHFNAGFVAARLLGLSPDSALVIGCAFSGYYVRSAESPSLGAIGAFLQNTEFATLPS
ncbi:MAG: carbohydrate kinase family protein [Verrucomicrobiota bacterium]